MWRRARISPIGVEVTPSRVRLLQVEWGGDSGRVHASAEVQFDGTNLEEGIPDPLAGEIQAVLKAEGFVGRRAVVALPSDHMIVRHVKVEPSDDHGLHDALLFELEDAFPGDAAAIQYLDVGEIMERGEVRRELILLAAGVAYVERFAKTLENSGLELLALDAEACALVRTFVRRRRRRDDLERHTAIIHVGETCTLMTIMSDGDALFMKELPLGASHLFATVQQRLGLEREEVEASADAEAGGELSDQVRRAARLPLDQLSLELSACLRYHAASRRSPDGVDLYLSGAGVAIPGIATALADALSFPVNLPDPFAAAFSGVDASPRVGRRFGSWAVPLGLALREAP